MNKTLENYLKIRRAMGFTYYGQERSIKKFLLYMRENRYSSITENAAQNWIDSLKHLSDASRSARQCHIADFARYAKIFHPEVEIPRRTIKGNYERSHPYIYTDNEIQKLLKACLKLTSVGGGFGLRRHTYYAMFGLIAVTGCRVGEILELSNGDVDLEKGLVTLSKTKYNNVRLLPLHESTTEILREYYRIKSKFHLQTPTSPFFISDAGVKIKFWSMRWAFIGISRQAGLRRIDDRIGPRVHDLRHTFAIRTIMDWYKNGVDVDAYMPILSTYLGHQKPTDTYWYLTAIPELMALAAQSLERRLKFKKEDQQ